MFAKVCVGGSNVGELVTLLPIRPENATMFCQRVGYWRPEVQTYIAPNGSSQNATRRQNYLVLMRHHCLGAADLRQPAQLYIDMH